MHFGHFVHKGDDIPTHPPSSCALSVILFDPFLFSNSSLQYVCVRARVCKVLFWPWDAVVLPKILLASILSCAGETSAPVLQ